MAAELFTRWLPTISDMADWNYRARGIVPGDAAGGRVFSVVSPFPLPFSFHTQLAYFIGSQGPVIESRPNFCTRPRETPSAIINDCCTTSADRSIRVRCFVFGIVQAVRKPSRVGVVAHPLPYRSRENRGLLYSGKACVHTHTPSRLSPGAGCSFSCGRRVMVSNRRRRPGGKPQGMKGEGGCGVCSLAAFSPESKKLSTCMTSVYVQMLWRDLGTRLSERCPIRSDAPPTRLTRRLDYRSSRRVASCLERWTPISVRLDVVRHSPDLSTSATVGLLSGETSRSDFGVEEQPIKEVARRQCGLALKRILLKRSGVCDSRRKYLDERGRGGAVARLLASYLSEPGFIPGGATCVCACGNRAGRCRWWAGFLGGLSISPALSFYTQLPYFIGSQGPGIESRPNLCTRPRETPSAIINDCCTTSTDRSIKGALFYIWNSSGSPKYNFSH
ncbi:hypothetical protein PR048_018514 [Dryococelus australis]|uniref:Uncharacterized protein n=1 Tax=Dryococelus australis TaxID=614101 RepID=A0ABQ9HCK4_9NEOP|nr:hypothetical protein PR048_018514 [Dryococelus australis]